MRSSRSRLHLRSSLWLYLSLIAFSLVWLLLDQWQVLRPIQNLAMDARFKVRGPLVSPVRVVYVDIDSQSLAKLGAFPWDRGIYAQVCDGLITQGGAKAVGIDVVFSSGGIPNIADMDKFNRGQWEFGRYLAKQPPVVLAASYASTVQKGPDGELLVREPPRVGASGTADAPELPEWEMGPIIFTPSYVGLIDTVDSETRQAVVYSPVPGRPYYTIALELARLHFGLRTEDIKVGADHLDLTATDGTVVRRLPLSEGQYLDINWFSKWQDDKYNPRVSLVTVHTALSYLKSNDPKAQEEGKAFFADNYFKDAIVLIGPVDPLMQDIAPTSFDHRRVPKVGVHGNLVKTIVSGRFLRHPPAWALPLLTIGLTAVVVILSLASEGRRSTWMRVGAAVVLVGYVVFSFAAFAWWDWVVPVTAPVGAALSAAFIGGAAQLVLAQKQKSRIKGLFGAYLAPAVVSQMIDSGQEPKLGGVEEEITSYFSDVQSFSTFSEVLSATQLVELMNEYLTACTDIVQAEGGTLDKYIGDAVVAIYGAPLLLPGHAFRACVSALRVQRRCGELRDKWGHELAAKNWPEIVTRLRTRVGLNTGRAVVGNMGSATRFSYTMMGDTVNLAARMESGAKAWGVFTMCAEPTRVACLATDPDRVVFRALGRVVVKGRSAPVPIHELVGLKEDVTDATREAIARFEEGLACYYAQDWDGALAKFRASAALEPNKPDVATGISNNPSLIYQDLVATLRANPPGPQWNGAYVMSGK